MTFTHISECEIVWGLVYSPLDLKDHILLLKNFLLTDFVCCVSYSIFSAFSYSSYISLGPFGKLVVKCDTSQKNKLLHGAAICGRGTV